LFYFNLKISYNRRVATGITCMPQAPKRRLSVARSAPDPQHRDDIRAIRRLLRYLADEASRTHLPLTAYLIGLAEASIAGEVHEAGAPLREKH
jgi:hypothetical protein